MGGESMHNKMYGRLARLAALGEKVEALVKGKPKNAVPRKRRKKAKAEEPAKKIKKKAKPAPEEPEDDGLDD